MEKIDYKKVFADEFGGKVGGFRTVHVPARNYIMIDGKGDPNTSAEYIDAIQTLYPVAYTLKFMVKKELELDYGVMPLEGLWWMKDMTKFTSADKSDWLWTAMIMQPDCVSAELFERAVQEVKRKKNPSALSKLRFEQYTEGRVAQVLYLGSYSEEGPTIASLHAYIAAEGGVLNQTNKHHHEIYLGDPRRSAPEKLKTIIRQPY